MITIRDVPSNKPTKQSEIEEKLKEIEINIKGVQSTITTLSERLISILRSNTPVVPDEPEKELPNTPMARRLVVISAALASAIREIDFLIDRCEL